MGDGTKLELILAAKDLASKEVNRLHGALGRLHTAAGKVGGGFKSAGAHLAKFGLIAGAGALIGITALVGGILASAKASAEEATGIKRLDAALRANVKGYKGNTDAIEKRIAAQERLGFSDDAQRESLAKLVTRYGNLKKAQDVQTLAMDYARLKNVDLVTATDQVAKGLDGNSKILKTLGIEYKKGGDKAALFGEIQDKVKGQAKAFGETAAGAMEAIKITLGDVVEDLGAIFLPMLTRVAIFVRDNVVPALSQVVARVGAWIKANGPLISQIGAFVSGAMSALFHIVGVVAGAIGGHGSKGGPSLITTVVKMAKTVLDYVVPKVQALFHTFVDVAKSVGKVVGPIISSLLPAFGKVVSALFGGGASSTGGGKKGPGKKGGGTKSGGGGGLVGALGDLIGVLWGDGNGALANAVKIVGAAFTHFLLPAIEIIINVVKTLIGWVGDAIKALQDLAEAATHVNPGAPTRGGYHGFGGGHAGGGATFPGQSYIVGENRPELLTMGRNGTGYVSASVPRSVDSKAAPSVIHTHVYLDKRQIAEAVDEYNYRTLRRAAPTGGRI